MTTQTRRRDPRTTYRKMIPCFVWVTGYNVVAIPLADGALTSPFCYVGWARFKPSPV